MSKPHKIKIVASNSSTYSMLAVCEYCGKTAFYGNKEAMQDRALGECQNSPDFTTLLGTEVLYMIQRIGNPSNGTVEQS